MRRKDREVTDFSEMTEIMKACDCCRLGFSDGEEAYIVPMNFGYDIDNGQITLYFHCANEGRKIDLLSKRATVAFEMDTKHQLTGGELGCNFTYLYQCIMGTGSADFVSDANEKIYALKRIMFHYTNKAEWEFDESLIKETTVFKLTVKTWSCKVH